MLRITSNSVLSSEVAEFLGQALVGENVVVYGPATIDKIQDSCIIYLKKNEVLPAKAMEGRNEVLVLCETPLESKIPVTYIVSKNTELDFVRVINHFFAKPVSAHVDRTAVIDENCKLGKDVSVHAGSYIGPDVEIGDKTIIFQNVVITGKVKIGKDCVIKANSTIGSEIFNFVYGENEWQQFPQIGSVIIGDNVWIGANSTIEKGSLSDTVIEDGVRIDDLVQIGSSSTIGQDSIVAAGTVICNQVKIGKKSWIAPNAAILQKLTIGDNCLIGLGSVVIDHVDNNLVVAGNPAKKIKNNK